MKTIELKILKLKDKRAKLKGKLEVIDAKLLALQKKCKHPSTRQVSWAASGGGTTACIICNKILERH